MIFINFVKAFIFLLANLHFTLAVLPVQSACGTQTNSPSISGSTLNRVINGANSNANSWPWVVSIRLYDPDTNIIGTHFCGATLIYEDLVLTAAHCVDNLDASGIAVVIGVQNIATETAVLNSNTYLVSDRYYHASYSSSTYKTGYDIAILKLATNVTLSTKIALACLPSSVSDATSIYDKNTVATGWGSTDGIKSTTSVSSELQQATLKVINGNSICTDKISYESSLIYCAFDSTGSNANICYGDSGGSIVYYANSKWYVYGVTSYTISYSSGNCDNTAPSYFTQVPKYLDWIEYGLAYIASGQVQAKSAASWNVHANWLLSMSFVLVVLMK